jgi:vacuolar-type H+-ATPase subunit E/Vma4
MADTIESFVKTLQVEGVQAGEAAAEEIRTEAEQQAQQILKQAQEQAKAIITDAQAQADSQLARYQGELKMAVRDAVLRLHETLSKSLEGVFTCPVEAHLSDTDFLKPLLHEIVTQYARADCEGSGEIQINVGPEMHRQLADWAIGELRQAAQDHTTRLNLKDTLFEAGFEYQVSGATVDVTVDSVVATLAELVGPQLRKLLQESTEAVHP